MLLRRSHDPFSLTADPRMYVPRSATERALDELVDLLQGGELTPRLAGPPGLGKTLLLHVLPERLGARWRCAYMGYPKLTPEELWIWVAEHLGLGQPTEEAACVVAAKAAEKGGGLVLMIDDAQAMPEETRRLLAGSCAREPGLRVVLTDTCEPGELGQPCEVKLVDPMTVEETEAYVIGRLEGAGLNRADHGAFRELDMERLHELTEGVPARVHYLATSIQRGDDVPGAERTLIRSLLPEAIGERTRRVGATLTGALAPLLGSASTPSPAETSAAAFADGEAPERPGRALARSLRGTAAAPAIAEKQGIVPGAGPDPKEAAAEDADPPASPTSPPFKDETQVVVVSEAPPIEKIEPTAPPIEETEPAVPRASGQEEQRPSKPGSDRRRPSTEAPPEAKAEREAVASTQTKGADRGAKAKTKATRPAGKEASAEKAGAAATKTPGRVSPQKDHDQHAAGSGKETTPESVPESKSKSKSESESTAAPKIPKAKSKKRPAATRRKTPPGPKAAKPASATAKKGASAAKRETPAHGSPAEPRAPGTTPSDPSDMRDPTKETAASAPASPGPSAAEAAAFVSSRADATAKRSGAKKLTDREAISEIGAELERNIRRQQRETIAAQGRVTAVPAPRATPEKLWPSETTPASAAPESLPSFNDEVAPEAFGRLARWQRESFLSVWGAAPLAAAFVGMVVLGGSVYQLGGWGRSIPGSVDSLDRGLPLGDRGATPVASGASLDPESPSGLANDVDAPGSPPLQADVAAGVDGSFGNELVQAATAGTDAPLYGPEPAPGFSVRPETARPQAPPLPSVAAAPPERALPLESVAEVARAEPPPALERQAGSEKGDLDPFGAVSPNPAAGSELHSAAAIDVDLPGPDVEPGLVSALVPEPGLDPSLTSASVSQPDLDPGLTSASVSEPGLDPSLTSASVSEPGLDPSLTSASVSEPGLDPVFASESVAGSEVDSPFALEPTPGSDVNSAFASESVPGSDLTSDFVSQPGADLGSRADPAPALADEVDRIPIETPNRSDTISSAVIETAEPAPTADAAPLVIETGRLSVNARPWAEIVIDGKKIGETPLGEIELSFGTHEVVARFPSGEIRKETVEVGAKEIFLVLRP